MARSSRPIRARSANRPPRANVRNVHMRNAHRTLLFSALASCLIGATGSEVPVAISCKGSAESTYNGKISRSWPTRIYVLDEASNLVAYWNPDKEQQISICDSKWKTCQIEFGPKIIEVHADLNKSYGFYMRFDRRYGSIYYGSVSGPNSKWEFSGTCEVTRMPSARTESNKF